MASYGITAYFQENCLGTIDIAPFYVGSTAAQLHTGAPGPLGANNISAVGQLQLIDFTVITGILTQTGSAPSWSPMTTSEVITGVSIWTGLDTASSNCLFTAPMLTAEEVASGDILILNGLTLPLSYGLAS